MENIKKQIIDWFNGPQDFDQGLNLLQQVSKKNKVRGKLAKRGETRSSIEKLIWELNKVAGLKKIPAPKALRAGNGAKSNEKKHLRPSAIPPKGEEIQKSKFNLIGEKDLDSYPPEVRRLVKEYSSLYMQRGKKHAAIRRLGDGNDQEKITARQPLIADIKKMSDRMEVLYIAFNGYEKEGFSLDQNFLWPEEKIIGAGQQAIGSIKTIEELKIQKKNIQSSVTKDRNLLAYGSKTKPKDGKEKPIPAGPKRTTLEKRIAKKEKEIIAIDQLIADLG
jgi:hypothetical protein